MTNAKKTGDPLTRSSGRSTQTYLFLLWKIPCAQPSRNTGGFPEKVPLNFTEDDVTWVASKLSDAAGALGAEAIEVINWLLCFGCVSEELRVVFSRLDDWMANSSTPWAAHGALMACCLVVVDKRPGVCPGQTRNEGNWVPGKYGVC